MYTLIYRIVKLYYCYRRANLFFFLWAPGLFVLKKSFLRRLNYIIYLKTVICMYNIECIFCGHCKVFYLSFYSGLKSVLSFLLKEPSFFALEISMTISHVRVMCIFLKCIILLLFAFGIGFRFLRITSVEETFQ